MDSSITEPKNIKSSNNIAGIFKIAYSNATITSGFYNLALNSYKKISISFEFGQLDVIKDVIYNYFMKICLIIP